jgi:hypothetical protein
MDVILAKADMALTRRKGSGNKVETAIFPLCEVIQGINIWWYIMANVSELKTEIEGSQKSIECNY